MNTTQSNIQHHFMLHETAMELLRLISRCKETGDQWGVDFFSGMYTSILHELTSELNPNEPVLSEEERNAAIDKIFSTDLSTEMWVSNDNFQLFTPENE